MMKWTSYLLAEILNRSNRVPATKAVHLGLKKPCSLADAKCAAVASSYFPTPNGHFYLLGNALTRISLFAALAIHLGLNTISAAEPTSPFLQNDLGLVAIEAEYFQANIAQGKHQWVADKKLGFSGEGAMKTSPGKGTKIASAYDTQSPRLDYEIEFTTTGTHYVWVRAFGRGGGSNSIHVGLDGQMLKTSANIHFPLSGDYDWNDGLATTIEVDASGVHTLNLWMREPGTVVDKIVLSTDAGYVPTGTGPAESPTGEGPPPPVDQAADPHAPIAIEAEHYHAKVAKSKHRWTPKKQGNYSGEGAMMAAPEDKLSIKSKYDKKSPRMNYQVNITTPGTYFVWLRALGPKGSSNSVHLGLNGKPIKAGKNITVPVTGDYAWTRGMETPIKITKPGLHTLNLWMRESGTIIDKIVLSSDVGYEPTGQGPKENVDRKGNVDSQSEPKPEPKPQPMPVPQPKPAPTPEPEPKPASDPQVTLRWDPIYDERIKGFMVLTGPTPETATEHQTTLSIDIGTVDPRKPEFLCRLRSDLNIQPGEQVCFRLRSSDGDNVSEYSEAVCTKH